MNPLTVIAKIRTGEEQALRDVLEAISDDLAGNPYTHLPKSRTTHFARWLIIDDRDNGPRLLFASDYDGDLDNHLQDLADVSPGLDEIWGKCEGYAGRASFVAFMRVHAYDNVGTFVAFPDETLASLQAKISLRRQLERSLDLQSLQESLDRELPAGELAEIMQSENLPPSRWDPVSAWKVVRKTVHGALRTGFLRVAETYTSLGTAKTFNLVSSSISSEEVHNLTRYDTAVSGPTSFTVFADILPERLLRLKIALQGTQILTNYGFPPGNFAGVYTLHTFRWILLDGDTRLIFMSTFDGTWQNYMGDFVDKLVWALNALYSNCEGYPAAGMRDVYPFMHWIRTHQPQPLVVYNAYDETVLNLIADRKLSKVVAQGLDPAPTDDWNEAATGLVVKVLAGLLAGAAVGAGLLFGRRRR